MCWKSRYVKRCVKCYVVLKDKTVIDRTCEGYERKKTCTKTPSVVQSSIFINWPACENCAKKEEKELNDGKRKSAKKN